MLLLKFTVMLKTNLVSESIDTLFITLHLSGPVSIFIHHWNPFVEIKKIDVMVIQKLI